jgi:hypothetical protein
VSAESAITYEATLVEGAVLLAERGLSRAEAARFRAQRDRIYECADDDEREARFEELHGRFFIQFGLDRPLHAVLAEYPEILYRVGGCHVSRAVAARDEGADLRDRLSPDTDIGRSRPLLVFRLRPESLLDPGRLSSFFRHELQHVADMLDPAFGYQRELPVDGDDPARANLARERYRAVWDATVHGRLGSRHGFEAKTREDRRSAFVRAFPALGDGAEPAFERWLKEPSPTHRAILEFIGAA